jgi:hypothetical protein
MHFHFLSFLLGSLFGIALVVFLVYSLLQWSVKDDEMVYRRQRQLDGYPDEDHSLK